MGFLEKKIINISEKSPRVEKLVNNFLQYHNDYFKNITDPIVLRQTKELILTSLLNENPEIKHQLFESAREEAKLELLKIHKEATEGMVYSEKDEQYIKKDYLKSGEYLN